MYLTISLICGLLYHTNAELPEHSSFFSLPQVEPYSSERDLQVNFLLAVHKVCD